MTGLLTDLPSRIASKLAVVGQCWQWEAHSRLTSSGRYGQVRYEGKVRNAHLVIYELLIGAVPEGKELHHLLPEGCVGTLCCWPGHVQPKTHRENTLLGVGPTAVNARKVRCIHGHMLSGENMREKVRAGGRIERVCRECERKASRDHMRRVRQVPPNRWRVP